MSLLIQCDGDECYNSDYDEEIYPLSKEAINHLKRRGMGKWYISHLCKDCLDSYNESFDYFTVSDGIIELKS